MRIRIQLSYSGTSYCGWQKQPGDSSVQQTLEDSFSMILRQPVEIVGCGRTDTGVHARNYTAHADVHDIQWSDKLVYQLNSVLPKDIAIHHISEADAAFHARFDAVERHYKYYLHAHKDPFRLSQSFYFLQYIELDQQAMHEAAAMILSHSQFKPFCKTGSDADHYKCRVTESNWIFDKEQAIYSIRANRFLRGMVRLIVGSCLNIGLKKISIEDLKESMDQQSPVSHSWSVPPEGLFLEDVTYP